MGSKTREGAKATSLAFVSVIVSLLVGGYMTGVISKGPVVGEQSGPELLVFRSSTPIQSGGRRVFCDELIMTEDRNREWRYIVATVKLLGLISRRGAPQVYV